MVQQKTLGKAQPRGSANQGKSEPCHSCHFFTAVCCAQTPCWSMPGSWQPRFTGSLPGQQHFYIVLTQKQNGNDDLPRNNCMNFHEPDFLSVLAYLHYLTLGEEA